MIGHISKQSVLSLILLLKRRICVLIYHYLIKLSMDNLSITKKWSLSIVCAIWFPDCRHCCKSRSVYSASTRISRSLNKPVDCISLTPWVGVIKSVFSIPLFSRFARMTKTLVTFNITFIFDRCHCSWATEKSGKHARYLKYITYIFAKSTFSATEKLKKELY